MKKILLSIFVLSFLLPTLAFASFDASLKYGSKGDAVIELQDFLFDQGVYTGKSDGRFGLGTRKAVVAFQLANGLKGDGYFGLGSRTKANTILGEILKPSLEAEQADTGTTTSTTISTIVGCTATSAYSSTTGQSCVNTTQTTAPNLPAGCTSTTGFSITTGKACNGTVNAVQQLQQTVQQIQQNTQQIAQNTTQPIVVISPVIVPPTPIDVCPNIEGIQTFIPIGMQIVNGNCVAVASAPINTAMVDIKINGSDGPITVYSGAQITISWTSHKVTSCSITGINTVFGNVGLSGSKTSVIFESNPVTIQCSGITLPDGSMISGTISDFVAVNVTPIVFTDVCPNITGVQTTIPTEMVLENGNCVATNLPIAVGTLTTTAIITSSSPASQYVIGGTNTQLATYNFKATNGTAIIDELTFDINALDGGFPISSLTVGGVNFLVSGVTATLTNLNISVLASYSGTNVPVAVVWNTVGLGNQASGQRGSITLQTVKYHVGNTTTTDTAPSVMSNTMKVVASKPTLTSTASTSNISIGENKLMDVTIAANTANDVKINALSFKNTLVTGGTITLANSATFLPRLAIGTTTLSGAGYSCTYTDGGTTLAGITVCTFPNDYIIPAGQVVTLSLYGTLTGTLGGIATTSLTTSLDASSTFSWTDAASNGLAITGDNTTYLFNYPTAVWVARN